MKYLSSPLKWAGSKAKVLPILLPILEKHKAKVFCEPFVGACNVSLNFDAELYIWNDLNMDITNTYGSVLMEPELYKSLCSNLFEKGFDVYYELRDEFNKCAPLDTNYPSVIRAALFQYLNKHGFNGLCRYNKYGKFNVPIGTSTKPKNVPIEQVDNISKLFRDKFISVDSLPFQNIFEKVNAHKDVLVYSDPPYVPLTSDFNYTGDGFIWEQQVLLKQLSKESKHTCIISNHWTPLTEELYSDADEIHVFDVQRTISCKGSDRKKVQECIVVYKGENK